ncbi:cardiolipin synthase, putative [Cryptococcus deneoformans JEC21]|uniref:Cardiolipin synthase, putative n=1 Tax=Cryptococcus deneoformans (strain JEC21 / ATCC MYA-565) TaxID=214684 RepID=Q5K7U3_CRYD1|nr:cardiolipin synthase, putative [Cryptococcus neoformans var. neoformans JEC21]AAW46918.2 cardiolipin synthase, putative [Cryptococcus neoformans var. neoformans JEC21]
MLSTTPRAFFIILDVAAHNLPFKLQTQAAHLRTKSRYAARQLSTLVEMKPRVLSKQSLRPASPRQLLRMENKMQGCKRYLISGKSKAVDAAAATSTHETSPETPLTKSDKEKSLTDLYESPYTIPNALTLARLLACPVLGYMIVQGDYAWATSILFASGVTDWLDGWLARRYNSFSVLGSILDPAADKALMTTLVGTLAWAGLLPVPLAILIVGRDVALSISAFYFRFISLPKPRTLRRYFDFSIPSAQVTPTKISKINTLLQLMLMGMTTISPLLSISLALPLQALQWTVAGTTIWSGLSYIGRSGVKILKQPAKGV